MSTAIGKNCKFGNFYKITLLIARKRVAVVDTFTVHDHGANVTVEFRPPPRRATANTCHARLSPFDH
jgi:hypothetical protein